MNSKKGFTLIEVIVAIAIIGLVVQMGYSLLYAGTTSYSVSTAKGFAQQDARLIADFIAKELRNVTDISEADYAYGEYFSLMLDGSGNLIKTKYIYDVDDNLVETIENTISGSWDFIDIKNTQEGVIEVSVKKTEKVGAKESNFELPIKVITENAKDMVSNLSVTLTNGDVFYYRNTKIHTLANSIYLDEKAETAGVENVTVKFYKNDGSTPPTLLSTVIEKKGSLQTLPLKPVRAGYIFKGWTDVGGTSYGNDSASTFIMPDTDKDILAIWEIISGLPKVTVNDSSIKKIDDKDPIKEDGKFIVKKKDGSKVKIQLEGFTDAHKNHIEITIANTTIVYDNNGFINIDAKANKNGANETFNIVISISTPGHVKYEYTYNFITK